MGDNMIRKAIEIDDHTSNGKFSNSIGYKDINTQVLKNIADDSNLKFVQMSKNLPDQALDAVDEVLTVRPDLIFRIYGMYKDAPFDLSRLLKLKNLQRLYIDFLQKKGYDRFENIDSLSELKSLRAFYADVSGNIDLGFISDFNSLESLYIYLEFGKIVIDQTCFNSELLREVHLGGKAVDYLELIPDNKQLSKLVVFSSKISDYSFVSRLDINELCFVNCTGLNASAVPKNDRIRVLKIVDSQYDDSFVSAFANLQEFKYYRSIASYESE